MYKTPRTGSSTAPDSATAFEGTAITGEGSQADQSRDLFAADGPELWEFSQQGATADGANAGSRAQDFLVLFPQRVVLDEPIEVLIGAIKVLFEIGDMGRDAFFDRFRSRSQVIFLSDDHVDDLSSTYGQRSEFQGELVRQGTRFGTNRLSVVRQDCGIDAIGLGQLSSAIWRSL